MVYRSATARPSPPRSAQRCGRCRSGLIVLSAIAMSLGGILFYGNLRWQSPGSAGTLLNVAASPAGNKTIRLASYNIHGGEGEDGRLDLARTAADMRGFDLIGLNEARGGFRGNQAAELGRILGMPFLFAPSERRWWHDSFGNGVLAAVPVDSWVKSPLPTTASHGFRTALLLQTSLDRRPLWILITHLTRREDRTDQLAVVMRQFLDLPAPAVLMGDLNTLPGDPAMTKLTSGHAIVDALDGRRGQAPCVDWILTRGLRVHDAGLIRSGASDHPLVWMEAGLP